MRQARYLERAFPHPLCIVVRRMVGRGSILGYSSVLCVVLSFGGTPPKVITAARTDHPPMIDGLVKDPQWQNAPPVLDFTQYDPQEGGLPTELTSVRVLYDDDALYVGVICYDSKPSEIVQQLTRRDRTTESDRFTVQIDSYNDNQTAFVFSTNVSGVQSDGVLSQDGTVYDITWDAVWNVKTRKHMDGWSAEFEIPYQALRFVEQEGEVYEWGINFRRYISRKRETDEWVMIPRSERAFVSKWGHVDGIRNITPPLHLSLSPYASGTAAYNTATPGKSAKGKYDATGGLDLKYGLAKNFTFDATLNPDFGQVEVDQAVLNLTVFETRFPEKRPFLVEGSQLFTFGASMDNTSLPLFFSRRIGRQPGGSPGIVSPSGGSIEENPQTTTVLGAAKITGRTASGFSLGVVSAATDEESATVRDANGNTSRIRTEPRGMYNVGRVKQEFGTTSWVGGIATVVGRENTPPALSGGIDWNLRLDGGTYALDGFVSGARSSVPASNRDGAAGKVLFSRVSSEHWFYTTSYDFYTRYFDINAAGFFAQPHDHGGYVQLLYRENFAGGIFRRYFFSLNPDYRWNWDGVITQAVMNTEVTGEFTNFWLGDFLYTYSHPAYDDAERRIIGTYKRPAKHTLQFSLTTDQRSNVSASFTSIYETDVKRKRGVIERVAMTLRPASWVELTPVVLYGHTRAEEAWVFPYGSTPSITGTPSSLFGDRDVDQLDFELRGIVTFTRNLSLQFFSQVFLARGRYVNFRRLVSSTDLVAYTPPATFVGADFNEITFNANVLLRWEYLPGSTLYLVWTQGRFDDSGNYATGFGRRFSDTFALSHEDVILLKVSYLLPL